MDSNRGPLVSEATALPTETHNHCPFCRIHRSDLNYKVLACQIAIMGMVCAPQTLHQNRAVMFRAVR